MRIKIIFAYNGSEFQGSASQPHQKSVHDRMKKVFLSLGLDAPLYFASRTDKGVHANAAVASTHTKEYFKDLARLKYSLNKQLLPHIYIRNISFVREDFNPRFDAIFREYRYLLYHKESSPFLHSLVCFHPKIDIKYANSLLFHFQGEHDFLYLCKQEKRNTKKTLEKAYAYSYKNYSVLVFKAQSFLRAQIRMSVSLLLKTLEGKIQERQLKAQIAAKECYSSTLAPASGLYLNKIYYCNQR